MTDYMLRTDTEAQMDDALEAAGLLVETDLGEGEIALVPAAGVTLDHIGPIPARLDPEDPSVILKPGDNRWHTNIRVTVELTQEQIDELPTFAPEPSVPYRVFL